MYKSRSTAFNECVSTKKLFHERLLHDRIFQKMQEKNDEEKSSNPRLLIVSVGGISRQEILDISAD